MNTHLGLVLSANTYSSDTERFNISDYTLEERRFVSNKDFDIRKLIKEVIPERTYKPSATDKIFFLPDCTVPRFKLRKMIKDHNIALVKTEDRSNIKFIGPETIKNLFVREEHYPVPKDDVLKALNYARINYGKAIDPIHEMLNLSSHHTIYLNRSCLFGLHYVGSLSVDCDGYSHYRFVKDTGYDDLIRWMQDEQVYDQKEILSHLNAGLMTKGEYESISRLFESTDNTNHKIAMEMMANCDYEESCLYLLFLIRDFGAKMDQLPNKTHVNFKSLLKFFDVKHLSNFSDSHILESLIQNKLLNQTNLDYFITDAIEEFRSITNLIQDFGEIIYTDEIYKALSENILDQNKKVQVIFTPPEELKLQL